ncbi:cold-shock DNA-binding protein family [Paracoccus alcaliphilus]|uniref:Cold-shock DNA-binding protein family n=1 Tax=Paracoccus alcaliphilus TaxID=34002 RepID=A0A1H8KZH1_9RHOB|nr:cold shock domain-containing protein [Paracoccus alcaliphilus]WCR17700.1 cold shock domain-containing protein [Paracoccus alcaliphilus]SEN97966.1 cold-shock DNA-binding protein family [Paracoccus alcaliphilus]
MTKEDDKPYLITGLVKWYDPSKGYGFIVNGDGQSDILLHANVLRNFGRSSVADQSRISAWVQQTGRGLQATEVVDIEPPDMDGAPPIADLGEDVIENLDDLPLCPARVKWFDKAKGFGFANIFGNDEDVFVHIEVLRHSGFGDLAIGEAVCLRVIEGPRGLMAAQICSWDSANDCSPRRAVAGGLRQEKTGEKVLYMAHVAE